MKLIAVASEALKSYNSIKCISIIWIAYIIFLIWAYHFSLSCFATKDKMCINAEDAMEVFNVIGFLSLVPLGTLLSITSLISNKEANKFITTKKK